MLNAVGLQNIGVEAFVKEKLPVLQKYNTHVLVNVFGTCLEEYVEVIERLEEVEGVSAYELNISCPNVREGGMQFGSDPALVEGVVGATRKAAKRRPLWVKLMPLVGWVVPRFENNGIVDPAPAVGAEVPTIG